MSHPQVGVVVTLEEGRRKEGRDVRAAMPAGRFQGVTEGSGLREARL